MKRITLASLALLLCAAMLFLVLPAEVSAAEVASGTCGSESTWVLTSDGTLTISGTGAAGPNFGTQPWETYRTSITKVVVEQGITELNPNLFAQCANLTSVTLPSSLTKIEGNCFEDCVKLKSITIPEGVTEIGYSAFDGCTALTTVTLPSTLTTIGNYAFANCSSLNNITLPGSVEEIGGSAFASCTSLTSIVIPNSVTELKNYMFSNCTALTSVTLPQGITEIPTCFFQNCSALKTFTVPEGVITIGDSAFQRCTSLTSITIPDSVTDIKQYAFSYCSALESIQLPKNIAIIPSSLFSQCTALKEITIPSGVATIGSNAFSGCTSLTSVSIPNTVTTIKNAAFYGCAMKEITIPASVISIEGNAFGDCDTLDTVIFKGNAPTFSSAPFSYVTTRCYYPKGNSTWTDSVKQNYGGTLSWLENGTELGGDCGSQLTWSLSRDNVLTITPKGKKGAMTDYSYYSSDKQTPWYGLEKMIHSVVINEGVTRIGTSAFYNCVNLKSVTLPSTLIKIGDEAFYNCGQLTNVTLPEKLTGIGNSAFYNCRGITSISIPKTVTEIGSSAFSSTGLKKITVPSSVTSLGGSAFSGCWQLKTASIPGSVGSLPWSIFNGCSSLTNVTLGSGITRIGSSAFNGCAALVEISLPASLTDIDGSAFMDCESLTTITLPRNVNYLGSTAFKNCVSLQSINLPAGIRKINSQTFYECASLETVTFSGDAPESIDSEAFLNVYATVYYPKGNTTWKSSNRLDYGGELTWKTKSMPKLKITQQPVDVTVRNGKSAKVTVKAEGEDLIYRWYYYVDGEGFKLTTSFTGNYYKITMNAARDGRRVYCVITDKYGNKAQTDTVRLEMTEDALEITSQPKGVAVAAGKTAKVTVKAEGDGLKYTWYVKDPGATKFTKSSVTKSSYSVKMTAARSGRQLYCIVTDSKGNEVRSNTVTISRITISKQPTDDTAASNKKVSTTVKAVGDGLKYQWYVKDAGKTKFSKSSVQKATYGYTMSSSKSGREAYCVITDKYGNSVTTDTVVFSRMYINTQPKNVTVASGKTAKTTVKAVGEDLTYTWYVKDPGKSSFSKSSITKSSYSVKMTKARSGRQVYCIITDAYGNTIKTNTVTLKMK